MKKSVINENCLGVWMDHAEARLIEYGKSDIKVIHSVHETNLRIEGETTNGIRMGNNRTTNNEYARHQIDQMETLQYYRELAKAIKPYNVIFIFGPTTAKREFHNFLVREHQLQGKRITLKPADQMTKPQMIARVRDFFSAARN